MKEEDNEVKDFTMVSVGYRVPKYLSDFIASIEKETTGLNKSDIIRKILETIYSEPWIIENAISGKDVVRPDTISEQSTQLDEINDRIVSLENQIESNKLQMENILKQQNLTVLIVEKLLGVSFNQLSQMPEQVLEQLYAGYIAKNTKP